MTVQEGLAPATVASLDCALTRLPMHHARRAAPLLAFVAALAQATYAVFLLLAMLVLDRQVAAGPQTYSVGEYCLNDEERLPQKVIH